MQRYGSSDPPLLSHMQMRSLLQELTSRLHGFPGDATLLAETLIAEENVHNGKLRQPVSHQERFCCAGPEPGVIVRPITGAISQAFASHEPRGPGQHLAGPALRRHHSCWAGRWTNAGGFAEIATSGRTQAALAVPLPHSACHAHSGFFRFCHFLAKPTTIFQIINNFFDQTYHRFRRDGLAKCRETAYITEQ